MTKILKQDESYEIIYTGTGNQEEIIFDLKNGYPLNGSIRVIGGSSDVYTLQTKIADSWQDAINSYSGKITDLTLFGKGKGIRLNITTNTSGSIKLEILG